MGCSCCRFSQAESCALAPDPSLCSFLVSARRRRPYDTPRPQSRTAIHLFLVSPRPCPRKHSPLSSASQPQILLLLLLSPNSLLPAPHPAAFSPLSPLPAASAVRYERPPCRNNSLIRRFTTVAPHQRPHRCPRRRRRRPLPNFPGIGMREGSVVFS